MLQTWLNCLFWYPLLHQELWMINIRLEKWCMSQDWRIYFHQDYSLSDFFSLCNSDFIHRIFIKEKTKKVKQGTDCKMCCSSLQPVMWCKLHTTLARQLEGLGLVSTTIRLTQENCNRSLQQDILCWLIHKFKYLVQLAKTNIFIQTPWFPQRL